jgi:hypothetical protein
MLEIGSRARRCAERRWIQQATFAGKQGEASKAATDLKPPRADVLVWHTVAREVEDRAEQDRREPRAAHGSGRGATGYMQGNNHAWVLPAADRLAMSSSR